MPRNLNDRVQRAVARQLLGQMQAPEFGRTPAEPIGSGSTTAASAAQARPKEDTVTDSTRAPREPKPPRDPWPRNVYGRRVFLLGVVFGLVVGGVATFYVVYFREFWFGPDNLSDRPAFVVAVTIGVCVVVYLTLYKGGMRYRRRVIHRNHEHRLLREELAETRQELEAMKASGSTARPSLFSSPPDTDSLPATDEWASISPRLAVRPVSVVRHDPAPSPVRPDLPPPPDTPAVTRRLRGTLGSDDDGSVGMPPPPDSFEDDDFDVPDFLKPDAEGASPS